MSDNYSSAFCSFRFLANGGRFTERGLPIITNDERDAEGLVISGKCVNPGDCDSCEDLRVKVTELFHQGWSVDWECVHCIKTTKKDDLRQGIVRDLPGVFQSGRDPNSAPLPELPNYDNSEDRPPSLTGCMRCGWQTSFLQLILRRQT